MDVVQNQSIDRQERRFFLAYIIIGFFAIVGGIYAFFYRVDTLSPVLLSLDTNGNEVVDVAQSRLEELSQKQLVDSDSDGINDFDEEFVYGTSIYLTDTDADGVTDKAEIDQGQDPLCVAGKPCTQSRSVPLAGTNTNTSATTTSLSNISDLSPTELRAELVKMGVPQDLLNQVNDQDLVATYQTAIQDTGINPTNASTTNTNTTINSNDPYGSILDSTNVTNTSLTPTSVEQLEQLDAAGIRDLLVQGGLSREDLEGIDDATLQQMYQETLSDQVNQINKVQNSAQ